ncbi:MAG: Ubiquinone/menaquinone biosynthesis methyltransferase UbiE [Candidatus Woesebacteria bacterium GW2011_GWA1_39_21]|uniref:Ubiquinone/menaquinone biosynthesis methyltransferase UbiE n=1 Tax=Candidatus Woesebacteria bacterium GW2011_GWA1_39_21 TaxID=1618550 RepID=A0A0G0NBJ3_9BACT|nr:MAG: Ubiquinone/menaquinone biosynthesis methyltransferase UbiE [Candidatus Woesebacteria bacterium GW2011_GWA1_39_21]
MFNNYLAIVRLGWDDYANVSKAERSVTEEHSILKFFSDLLPHGGKLLDVGCGSGQPITKYFYDKGFNIEGFDISQNQIEKARRNLPGSILSINEMAKYEYPTAYFDALVCLHSLEHTERIHHKEIMKKFYSALKPGGLMLISANTVAFEGLKPLVGEIQMFYSNFDIAETKNLVNWAKFSTIHEKYLNVLNKKHLYIIAKKGGGSVNTTQTVYSAKI